MPYDVTTTVFEGPFDLLLHLIMKEQVDLYEVSLSTIVDGYLAELTRMTSDAEKLDLEVATEFLLIAATLVELKARRLLPGRDDIDLDDEFALWQERDHLLARLLECKTFKGAASVLADLAVVAGRSHPRTAGIDERFMNLVPDLPKGVTGEQLKTAFLRAVTPKPIPRVDLRHMTMIRSTVSDAVAELIDELPKLKRISFRRLTGELIERMEVIVRFLAILELFKQGLVDLEQAATFGDIDVVWQGADVDLTDGLVDLTIHALAGIDSYEG